MTSILMAAWSSALLFRLLDVLPVVCGVLHATGRMLPLLSCQCCGQAQRAESKVGNQRTSARPHYRFHVRASYTPSEIPDKRPAGELPGADMQPSSGRHVCKLGFIPAFQPDLHHQAFVYGCQGPPAPSVCLCSFCHARLSIVLVKAASLAQLPAII